MSEKRTSTESRIPLDEQTTEDSDLFRQVDDAKRGKFASFSDTTLQDIPTEILQCILIKAITMEVKNMMLAKSVWKEKADLVKSRLGSVCSQWSNVLTTDFFRLELHRALDGIAQEKLRMDIVQESLIQVGRCYVEGIAALKDDIFLFCSCNDHDNTTSRISSVHHITVYDRKNMAEVKDVIEIPGLYGGEIAASNVSNCVYVVKENVEMQCDSVLRITKDEDQKFNIQTWISDLSWCVNSISVSDEGRVILSSTPDELNIGPHAISVFNPNGLLHHEVILSPDIYGFECIHSCVMRKSNENFVLASVNEDFQMVLTEIDTNGIIQRQYESSVGDISYMSYADASGRILIHNLYNRIELLDSELNLLEFTGQQSYQNDRRFFQSLQFNRERNEVMGISSVDSDTNLLRIFCFREE